MENITFVDPEDNEELEQDSAAEETAEETAEEESDTDATEENA